MWVVVIDPSGTGEWPDERVYGPFVDRDAAERVAFEMNERLGEEVVARALAVHDPGAQAPTG